MAFDGAGEPYKGPQYRGVLIALVIIVIAILFFAFGGMGLLADLVGTSPGR